MVLDARFTVVATLSEIQGVASASSHTDGFYVLVADGILYRIDLAGQVLDQWTVPVPAAKQIAMTVSPDNSTLYFAAIDVDEVTRHLGHPSYPEARTPHDQRSLDFGRQAV